MGCGLSLSLQETAFRFEVMGGGGRVQHLLCLQCTLTCHSSACPSPQSHQATPFLNLGFLASAPLKQPWLSNPLAAQLWIYLSPSLLCPLPPLKKYPGPILWKLSSLRGNGNYLYLDRVKVTV